MDLRYHVVSIDVDNGVAWRAQKQDPGIADIPIVILSGVEAEPIRELDAAAAFHKPVSFPEVVGGLRRLCDRAGA